MASSNSENIQIGPFQVRLERRSSRVVFGRRRREGLKLTVERDGSLKVTAPVRAPMKLVEEFVLAHIDWIENQREKTRRHLEKHPPKKLIEGEKVRFFGVERELLFEPATGPRVRVEVRDQFLVVSVRDSERTPGAIRDALAKYFDQQARWHLPERVEHFSKAMGVRPSGLSFRAQKTRWGSCSSQGHISFNWKIVFAPEAVIDYLVVHELAHLVHANHSEAFWDLVKAHDPEYREHRRWLREHQQETDYLRALV